MKLTVKYFFLAEVLFFKGLSEIWINIFSLGSSVLFWGFVLD
jgi:hypothetical protein